jgi:hypothetical protein
VQPRFDRGNRLVHHLGDLLVREPLHIPEDQDGPVLSQQPVNGAAQDVPGLLGQQFRFRSLRPIGAECAEIARAMPIPEKAGSRESSDTSRSAGLLRIFSKAVFVATRCSQVPRAALRSKVWILRNTARKTSWATSCASASLRVMGYASRYTRDPYHYISLSSAIGSPPWSRSTSDKSVSVGIVFTIPISLASLVT